MKISAYRQIYIYTYCLFYGYVYLFPKYICSPNTSFCIWMHERWLIYQAIYEAQIICNVIYIYIIVEKSPISSHMYDHGFMDKTNRQAVCKSQRNPLSDSQTAEELHWKP